MKNRIKFLIMGRQFDQMLCMRIENTAKFEIFYKLKLLPFMKLWNAV